VPICIDSTDDFHADAKEQRLAEVPNDVPRNRSSTNANSERFESGEWRLPQSLRTTFLRRMMRLATSRPSHEENEENEARPTTSTTAAPGSGEKMIIASAVQ
jgi:hypothetical protein